MNPKLQSAGIAGILTGIALAGEFLFFMMSGYNPQALNDPGAALRFIQERGMYIRLAVLIGAAGVAFRTLFVSGLAANLYATAPTRAVATLYFGILGGAGHGLVALSFYLGIPMLLAMAQQDPSVAANAWGAYSIIVSGFEGFGNFLIALMLLAASSAIILQRTMPVGLGWVGLLAGLTTLVRLFTTGTPLAGLGFGMFFPSLFFAAAFDVWAGFALWRNGIRESLPSIGRMQVQAD